MRRLLYCLLGSALLHGAFLCLPFSMSAGGGRETGLQPLQVRLLDAPGTEANKPKRPFRRAVNARSARNPKRRNAPERPRALSRTRAKPASRSSIAQATLREPHAVGRTARTGRKNVPTRPGRIMRRVPEPARSASRTVTPPSPLPARKAQEESGHDRGTAAGVEAARSDERMTPASPGLKTAVTLVGVRYARVFKPEYPRKARRAGWEGTTTLKVHVDHRGRSDRVMVERTSGFDLLDAAAVAAVRRWIFHPAHNGDRTVSGWVKIPVVFKLKEEDQR